MSSSSSDDIAAYLAHLKQTTAVRPRSSRGHLSPTKDSSISDALSPSPSKSSPVKKSSLKSPQKISSISASIQKYQDKYVKKNAKVVGKTLVRRSSVVFSVPGDDDVGSPPEQDPTDRASPEDSIMDDVLAKCLEETSISDEPGEFGEAAVKVKDLSTSSLLSKSIKPSHDAGGENKSKSNVLDISTTLSGKPILERKLGKGRLLQDSSRPKSAENSKGAKHKTSDGRSLSFENSDLKSVPEEEFGDDRTLSTTPERSHKSPLLKQTKSVFRSSSMKDDESSTSTSSSSQQYLSKRISRRNSYIYKEECALVSASSSNETIKTDPELSVSSEILELETDDRVSEASFRVSPELSSEMEISKSSQHFSAQKPLKVSGKTAFNAEVSTTKAIMATKEKFVTINKPADRSGIGSSLNTVYSPSVVSPLNEYTSSDFEPSSATKSSDKSSSKMSHDSSSQPKSSDSKSKKSRRASHERRSKHQHDKTSRRSTSSSHRTSSSTSSSDDTTDSSYKQRRREKRKQRRKEQNKHKHSEKSSRKLSCMNCERLRDLLWSAPRVPFPSYDGNRSFLQHAAAGYPVTRDQGLHNVSSNVTKIDDALRQTIILGRQFLLSQRAMYDAYCTTLMSSHRYTTMHGIEKIIRQNKRSPATLPEA